MEGSASDSARPHSWHRFRHQPLGPIETRSIANLFESARVYGPMIVALLLLACAVVRPYAPTWAVGGFAALLCVEAIVKITLTERFMRLARSSASPAAVWRLILPIGGMYAGVVYGLGALAMFLPMPEDVRLLLVAVYAALLAYAVWGMPHYPGSSFCLAVPMAAPTALVLLLDADGHQRLLGVTIVLITGAGLWVNRRTGAALGRLIELDVENGRLLDRLEQAMSAAERERRRAEQAVIDKSLFIATASHDLRQPVHALGFFQHALAVRCEKPADAALIAAVGESCTVLTTLLDGLLDVSSLDARAIDPRWQAFDAASLVDELAREFAPAIAAKGLTLRVGTVSSPVLSDRSLLARILRNLLSNAVKFSDDGAIALEASGPHERDGARVLRLIVTDEGPGIPARESAHVFADFYRGERPRRTRTSGTGLGLSIVARLCELLDVNVVLDSTPGRGTRIALDIPCAPEDIVEPLDAPEPLEPGRRLDGLRVLVVDDDRAILSGMRVTLESRGCIVATATDLKQALTEAHTRLPDVLLCDYRLEGDIDGVDVVSTLRRRHGATLAAAIVSGEPLGDGLARDACPGVELLRKPLAPHALCEALHRLSRRP